MVGSSCIPAEFSSFSSVTTKVPPAGTFVVVEESEVF